MKLAMYLLIKCKHHLSFLISCLFLFILFVTNPSAFANVEKPMLNIYTYDVMTAPDGLATIWKHDFEKQCACQVNLVSVGGSAALIRRAQLDQNIDILLGVNSNTMQKGFDLAMPYESTSMAHLVIPWQEKRFIPYDYSWLAFVAKKNLIKKIGVMPKSLNELIQNQQINVIMENPRSSGFANWITAIYADKTDEKWQMLKKHIVTITPGWSEAYALFLKGEADMVMSYNTSPAYHVEYEHDNSFEALNFDEGNYLLVETVAIMKTTKHLKLAQRFIDFILSKQAQKSVALHNISFPVIEVDLPESFKQIILPSKTIYPSSDEIINKEINRVQW